MKHTCNESSPIKIGVVGYWQGARAGLRWEMGEIAPGPPLQGGPRDEIYLLQIKYSFKKIL